MNISSASAESLSFGQRMIALGLVFIIIFLSDTFKAPITANAETYTVTPEGNLSLSEALSLAGAGDIIFLTDGKYTEPIVTVGGGEEGNPLKIVGTRAAVISGQFRNRAVMVQHSWITLEGFTVNGTMSTANKRSSYINKGVYVMGGGEDAPLDGFVMLDMGIHNCGGECVRLKNGVKNAEMTGNTVTNCGIYYYRFGYGDNNGEGFYIGTAAIQLEDLDEPDHCNDNLVNGNIISTNGNECVDIKEGSSGNIVTNNVCSWQMDQMSAGFNIRGNNNTIEDNTVEDCKGWGVRLGGWSLYGTQYGVNNSVHGNNFIKTGGAFNIRVSPQGGICGNSCEDGSCDIQYNWKYQDGVNEIKNTWDHSCN